MHEGIRIATDMEKAAMSQNAAATTTEAVTDVTPGNTHLILWGLAEEYIDQARSLCFIATTQPSSQPAWRKRHQDLIFCAIKCLAACVTLESPSMTQLDRAKTGLRLAQILFDETESLDRCEEEVNKAIIIANRIQGSTALDIQLRLYDLQIQIYIQLKKFRLAKTILGTASAEATTLDLHWWTYHLLLARAHVCFLMNDIAGSLSTLNQGAAFAEKRGDFDLKMAFWIVAGQYSLMLSNWDRAMSYLQKLAPHMGLDEELKISPSTTPPAPESSSTTTSSSSQQTQQPKLCQSKQLRVFFLILYISCMLRSGGVEKSLAALTTLHSVLDETRPKDSEELQGIFRIPLSYPKQNVHSQHEQNAPWSHLPIKWMSFSQVYCLTYLLSGICSKADMTQPMKAQQFLIEGIKVVDREFSINDYATSTLSVRRNQRWFSLLMMTMLVHLSDIFLLKYDLASAEETILKATYWSQVCGMWEVFKWRISLSIGMTMHLGGRLDEALDWYGMCLSHTQGSHQDPEGYDAKTLAIINTALIHCGERFYNLEKVKGLQMEARARHESNMSANIRCALHILDSWTKEAVIPARQHLQEALKLSSALMNTQLRSLTLLLLGNVYLQTHDEQAEKMLMTGFVHAEKTGNQVVAAAAGSCLKDLYLTTSQGIKASQQAQKNLPVLEAVDQAFQSRPMGPLLNDTNAEQK